MYKITLKNLSKKHVNPLKNAMGDDAMQRFHLRLIVMDVNFQEAPMGCKKFKSMQCLFVQHHVCNQEMEIT